MDRCSAHGCTGAAAATGQAVAVASRVGLQRDKSTAAQRAVVGLERRVGLQGDARIAAVQRGVMVMRWRLCQEGCGCWLVVVGRLRWKGLE
jgi:hypothetical protein